MEATRVFGKPKFPVPMAGIEMEAKLPFSAFSRQSLNIPLNA